MNTHVLFNNFLQGYHGMTLSDVMNLRIAVADKNDIALEAWDNYVEQFRRLYGDTRAKELQLGY